LRFKIIEFVMKKHLFIVVIVILAITVMGIALVDFAGIFNGSNLGVQQTQSQSFDSKIEALGTMEYEANAFDSLENAIMGQKTQQKITQAQYDAYLYNLGISKQAALCNSMEAWFRDDCSASDKSLFDQARSFQNPTDRLTGLLNDYSKFENALAFEGRLSYFLASEYDASKDQQLRAAYASAIGNKRFSACSQIEILGSRIDTELTNFKNFYDYTFTPCFAKMISANKKPIKACFLDGNYKRYPHYASIIDGYYK